MNRALEDVASLPTFEERAARAEQLQKVCIMARVRLRLSAEQVRLTTTARHEHEHMVLQVYDLIDEASRCLEQDDVERAYELVKAVQVYLPHVPRRSDNAQRLIIPCMVLPQVTHKEQQYYLGRTGTGGPLDVAVGIDSDSAITATTNRNDCVRINTGSSFLHNASVTGVGGGVSKIGGMGAMIVRVKVTRPNGAKEWGYLCDPNAAWLKKENRDEGTVRILSTTMIKRMGVIFRMEEYNDLDMLVCKRSGNMIETKISHGIVVIDTDPEFDARNFRKNEAVNNLIQQILMKEKSPLFFIDGDRNVISLPLDFNCGAGCGTSEQGL